MELEGYAFSFDENLEVPYEREELIRLYWQMHPRFRFVKSCKDGNFLDIGSGSGGLFFWKEWEQPIRNGLHMFAVDMQAGEFVDRYEAFRMCNLEHRDFPYENGFFDHVFSAHVFEHLQQPVNLIKNISKILKGGGMVYIEQPNHNSLYAPRRHEFQNAGITCATTTTNFYDDQTHRKPYSADEIIQLFSEHTGNRFEVIEKGTVWNEYLKDHMLAYAYREQDTEIWTYAVWLHFLWSDYVILRKREEVCFDGKRSKGKNKNE